MHHSEDISIQELLPHERGVVFVLNRLKNGEEAFTAVAPQLAQTAALPAQCQHHHVTGVTSAHLLARSASSTVAEVTLEEYLHLPQLILQLKTTSKGNKVMMKSKQRAQTLEAASLLFVTVDTEQLSDMSQLDTALVQAIQTEPHVVVTAVRSLMEINQEREQAMQYTMLMQREAGRVQAQRRRLEEDVAQEGQDNAQENMQVNNNQYEYMVLVHMTPNILSGILFTLLFATITLIGITCLGAIQGQDVYVKKMPAIGREA
jgi:hypothetical protein